MAFALAVGDLCSPVAVAAFASSTEPPVLGTVVAITPTKVVWQDGREQSYSPSGGASVDLGLSKVVVQLGTEFQNARVRPSGAIPFPNLDGRGDGIVVLVVTVSNYAETDLQVAIVRNLSTGLYTAIPTLALQVVPGA